MISATVVGNLGGDAEVKSVGTSSVTEFRIASSNGDKEKTTTWLRCSLWGERGAKLKEYLTKGAKVAISGRLINRNYDGKNGPTTSLECSVDAIEFCGGKKDGPKKEAEDDGIPF